MPLDGPSGSRKRCKLLPCNSRSPKISTDLAEMEKWLVARQEQANREGSLDIQFLNSRFEKGTKRVNDFAELNHLYIESDGLLNVQPDCLRFMANHAASRGSTTFPGSIGTSLVSMIDSEFDSSVLVSLPLLQLPNHAMSLCLGHC